MDHFQAKASHNRILTPKRFAGYWECHLRKTKYEEPLRFNQVPTNPLIYLNSLLQSCTNFSKSMLLLNVHNKFEITKIFD